MGVSQEQERKEMQEEATTRNYIVDGKTHIAKGPL